MRKLREIIDDPVQLGFWTFTTAVAVQFFHQIEHLLQIIQKNVWGWDTFPGVLGAVFDFEAVHFLYNAALFLSVLAVFVTYLKNPGIWRRSRLGHFALTFATVFQGYHLIEHTVKFYQYLGNRADGLVGPEAFGPGLVGMVVPVIELHFWINSVVIGTLVIAYLAFQPTPYGPAESTDQHRRATRRPAVPPPVPPQPEGI